jgi:hypothetical protein
MQEVCALVTGPTGHALDLSEKPVRQYWEQHGIAWHWPPGRICTTAAPDVETVILEFAGQILKRGVKKIHATLQLPQYDHLPLISYRDARRCLIREIYT